MTGCAPGIGEAIVDEQAAEGLGVGLSDTVTVLGAQLQVVGLSSGRSSMTNTTVFVSQAQSTKISGNAPDVPAGRHKKDRPRTPPGSPTGSDEPQRM